MKLTAGDEITLLSIEDMRKACDYINEYNELVFEDVDNDIELVTELIEGREIYNVSEVDAEGSFRVADYIHPNYWFSFKIVKEVLGNTQNAVK